MGIYKFYRETRRRFVPILVLAYFLINGQEVKGQSLLFRVPYFANESILFNPSFAGSDYQFRANSTIAKTAIPNDESLEFVELDFQTQRKKSTEWSNYFIREIWPRLHFTTGLSYMNLGLIRRETQFTELTPSAGFRVVVARGREEHERVRNKEKTFATKYRSAAFFSGNVFYHQVSLNNKGFNQVFNSNITFNDRLNQFNSPPEEGIRKLTGGTIGWSTLMFVAITPPNATKKDLKPVRYIQFGYRKNNNSIRTDLFTYDVLQVAHLDFHSQLKIGKEVRAIRALSFTGSLIYLKQKTPNDQNKDSNPFSESNQVRISINIHFTPRYYFNHDFGFEQTFNTDIFNDSNNVNSKQFSFYFQITRPIKNHLVSAIISAGLFSDNQRSNLLDDVGIPMQLGLKYQIGGRYQKTDMRIN